MFSYVLKYSAVICLTFSSMVLMLSQPTIIDEMMDKLKNCSFPPPEALKNSSQGGIFAPCLVVRPSLTRGRPSSNDLNFAFGKYLCMELFDLSLQLCSINVSKGPFPMSEEDINKISVNYNVTTFCEKLQFSNSRAKSTEQWANIAVDALKQRPLCESNCIMHGTLNPVCGAIAWASNLLIADAQKLAEGKTEAHVLAEPQPSEERVISHLKDQPANLPNGKEEVTVKGSNNTVTESKPILNKSNENLRPTNNEEISKLSESSAVGSPLEKHPQMASPTQAATVVASPSPITLDGSGLNNLEKGDDHEEDHHHPSKVEFHEAPGGDDGQMAQDDLLDNLPPKEGSRDNIPDDGLPGEDVQPRGNNDGVRLAQDDLLRNMASKDGSQDNIPDEVANEPTMERGFQDAFVDAQDSHFFAYFLTMVVICIVGYLLFHNKQKIIALALEGRRMQGSRRRPNTSSYKKLDSNLEEAVTSTCSSSSVTHVIF
ncbi:trans-Golgi network integral membrane protein 1-like isoform X1 [Ischnura elegans]|uniref:trans-Golgi network integral membrane protein 1-like isoform X1 n=1 Tax=Ischnura elegans TaxID=197161 RepID=UPI001ED8A867|nr:trans-Golgi network integral membrane protein 1-like isoform X1 [Ischnura elegans]